MNGSLLSYLIFFFGSLFGSLFLTPMALNLALQKEILDIPGGHKSHSSPIPYLGGVAIVTAFSLVILCATTFGSLSAGSGQLNIIVGLALLLAFTGLIDDLKTISPVIKFSVQIFCALCICLADDGVSIFEIEFIDWPITFLWVVGITNSFNLLDNMDGLAAGLAGIVSFTFFCIAATNGQFLVASLAVALSGCSFGFLKKNSFPAAIYMGDGGSLFLGFLISYLGLKLRFDSPISRSFLVPITACSIPILDTTVVFFSRLWHRRSPFLGGKDHISHRLVSRGHSILGAVRKIYVFAFMVGFVSFFITKVSSLLAGIIVATVWVFITSVAVFAWKTPTFYD
ncbi:MAG: MraY family glycosyltransferase [Nitrospinota bacterium]|nr:MraY family glycosyltransferase [Nitrospinota bacterium]